MVLIGEIPRATVISEATGRWTAEAFNEVVSARPALNRVSTGANEGLEGWSLAGISSMESFLWECLCSVNPQQKRPKPQFVKEKKSTSRMNQGHTWWRPANEADTSLTSAIRSLVSTRTLALKHQEYIALVLVFVALFREC